MCDEKLSDNPMSFLHLSLLTDLLQRDLEELQSDFETKIQFCKDQEQKCLDNAQNLLSVDQLVGTLNGCMLRLEMDLNANENNLIEAEKTVSRLEKNCHEGPLSKIYPLARSTYEELLEQLLDTEKMAAQCNNIKAEIEAFHQEATEKLAPSHLITKLINFHADTLETMEKDIKQLECQANDVQSDLDRLMVDKETKKCPCQPMVGNESMDILHL